VNRTLYHDTGRPITDQDMFVSQSGTTLSMRLGRTNADEKKNKIEMEFESRLLILGEFRTVSQVWFRETKKKLDWHGMLGLGWGFWQDVRADTRSEAQLPLANELRKQPASLQSEFT
jgi:hypothetical protein